MSRGHVLAWYTKYEFYDMPVAKFLERVQQLQEQHGDDLYFDWRHRDQFSEDPDLCIVRPR